jgi:hypothetical protein
MSEQDLSKFWSECPSLTREGNRCTFGKKCRYIHPERENNSTNEIKLEIILTCQRCQRNIEQSDLNANMSSQFSNPDVIPKETHFCFFQNSDTGTCRHMCGTFGKKCRYIHPERENNSTNEIKLEIILTCQRCQRNIEQSDLNANMSSQFSNPDVIPKETHFCFFQNSDTGTCRHMCGFHDKQCRQKQQQLLLTILASIIFQLTTRNLIKAYRILTDVLILIHNSSIHSINSSTKIAHLVN